MASYLKQLDELEKLKKQTELNKTKYTPVSKGVSSGTPKTLPKITETNVVPENKWSGIEKAMRAYSQNAYDMSNNAPKGIGPQQWNGDNSLKNITFTPGTSIADRAAKAGERATLTYQNAFLPKAEEKISTANSPAMWNGGGDYLVPYTGKNPTAFETTMQNAKNMENPATPTAVRFGTGAYDRAYNALSSIGDSRIGSDISLKETAKQSVRNEADYRKALDEYDTAIDRLIAERDKYDVASAEYRKLNNTINAIYDGIDKIRDGSADMTEANKFMQNANLLREQATKDLSGVEKDVANAAISAVDNLITMSMAGFNPVASTALMGISAAGQNANELSNRGVSATDAFGRGVVSGVIEGLTEKIGIDNLYSIIGSGNKNLLINLLKQSLSEGTEEGLSTVLNYMVDRAAGDNKPFDLEELADAVEQGFLSGAMFGAGGTVVNTVNGYLPGINGYSDKAHYNMAKDLENRKLKGILPDARNYKYSSDVSNSNVNIMGMPAEEYFNNRMPSVYDTDTQQENALPKVEKPQEVKADVPQETSVNATQEKTISNIAKNQDLNLTEIANLTETDANTAVPIKRNNKQKKGNSDSKFAKSIKEQNIYDDSFKEQAGLDENINTYDSITNEESMFDANELLKIGGASELIRWYNIDNNNATAKDVAEGFIMMKRYQDVGDYDSMIMVAEKLRKMGTSAGQTVQAFSIMKRMTPEGMVKYAQQSLDKALDKMKKAKTQKWIEANIDKFKLTSEDAKFITEKMKQVAQLPDGREKTVLLAQVQARIQNKIPPEPGQKTKTLARISMLFNPKTQVRNILGNVTVMPQAIASDAVGNVIDKIISSKTGVRTTGGFNIGSLKGVISGIGEAWQDYRLGINTKAVSGNKFEIGQGKSFSDKNKIGRALNSIDNLTSFLLDAGDRGFYNTWYNNSLKAQMRKNNVSEPTPEMREIAAMDALERTWQDDNGYTKMMSSIKKEFNRINIKGYGLGDMIMPFVKTPSNLVKAVVDYSPVGIVNAIVKDSRVLKNAINSGKNVAMAQKAFVNDMSKGIVGSLLMVLYAVLADKEIIRGQKDTDKDVNNFEKYVMGMQPYSLNIGDKTFAYEWAQPVGGTAAMMADAVNSYKLNSDEGEAFNAVIEGVKAAGNTLFNLTVMQGLAEFFDGGDVVSGSVETFLGEPSKFVSSFLGQIAQYGDETMRRTYENGNYWGTVKNEIQAKIPGLRNNLEPVVDVLGREVKSNNSFFDTFVNPANYYKDNSDKVANEIYELYNATGNKSLIPPTAPYSVTYKGNTYQLTEEDFTNYQKTTGSIIHDSIEDLILNSAYNNMTDEDKAEVYEDIYGYARDIAKSQLIPGYEIPNTSNEAKIAAEFGLSEADYYLYKYYFNKKDSNGKKMGNEEKRAQLEQNPYLSVSEKNLLDNLLIDDGFYMSKEKNVDYSNHESVVITQMSDSAQKRWNTFKEAGITPDEYKNVYSIATGDGKKVEKINRLRSLGYTSAQAAWIYKESNKKLN